MKLILREDRTAFKARLEAALVIIKEEDAKRDIDNEKRLTAYYKERAEYNAFPWYRRWLKSEPLHPVYFSNWLSGKSTGLRKLLNILNDPDVIVIEVDEEVVVTLKCYE